MAASGVITHVKSLALTRDCRLRSASIVAETPGTREAKAIWAAIQICSIFARRSGVACERCRMRA